MNTYLVKGRFNYQPPQAHPDHSGNLLVFEPSLLLTMISHQCAPFLIKHVPWERALSTQPFVLYVAM